MSRRRAAAAAACLALLLAACGGGGRNEPRGGDPTSVGSGGGTLRIMAAASLTGPFEEIAISFERSNPGVKVETSYAASSTIAHQIAEGAPADVFASADDRTMKRVVDSEKPAAKPVIFARNRLTIVVARDNPKKIRSLADLARRDLTVVLCAAAVPCGRFARESLAKAGVTVRQASDEPDVKATLAKVASGEADAGITYVTDARDELRVTPVTIPPEHNVTAEYPIVALTTNPLARAFVATVRAKEARSILERYGFLLP